MEEQRDRQARERKTGENAKEAIRWNTESRTDGPDPLAPIDGFTSPCIGPSGWIGLPPPSCIFAWYEDLLKFQTARVKPIASMRLQRTRISAETRHRACSLLAS